MSSRCNVSVSPVLICPLPQASDVLHAGPALDDDEVVDLKKAAILGEPTVGIEAVTLDHRGQGGLAARPLRNPLRQLSIATISLIGHLSCGAPFALRADGPTTTTGASLPHKERSPSSSGITRSCGRLLTMPSHAFS